MDTETPATELETLAMISGLCAATGRVRGAGPRHEGRFGVEHRVHGVFRFTRPDGEVLSDTVPRVMLEGCPMDLIV